MGLAANLPRDDERPEDLATAWITLQHSLDHSEEYNSVFWAWERLTYLTEYLPHKAWQAILLIWSKDKSNRIAQNLSAGPVEDLLAKHGTEMISLIETEARQDPTLASLLGGVWKNSMTDEVWSRLQAVWDRRGWDGNPR